MQASRTSVQVTMDTEDAQKSQYPAKYNHGDKIQEHVNSFKQSEFEQNMMEKQERMEDRGPPSKLTHGDVLQAVEKSASDLPVTEAEAAAIQSVEEKALGGPGSPLGLGDTAQSAAAQNAGSAVHRPITPITLGDVLKDAKEKLSRDKEVEASEADRIGATEARHNPSLEEQKLGIGSVEQSAAILNAELSEDKA